MTLFRKVFQSQARPAQDSETPDPEELRRTMAENAGETSPLVLEPEDIALDPDIDGDTWADEELFPEELEEHAQEACEDPTPENEVEDQDLLLASQDDDIEDETALEITEPEAPSETPKPETPTVEPDLASIMEQAAPAAAPALPAEAASKVVSETSEQTEAVTDPSGHEMPEQDDPVDLADFARQRVMEMGQSAQSGLPPDTGGEAAASSTTVDLSDTSTLARAAGRASNPSNRPAGRVKTRLLGFNRDQEVASDPLDQAGGGASSSASAKFPVGWLVVIDGPGMGHAFSIFTGASTIGRGDDQMISLNFGDNSISRQNHAAIAYDEEVNKFYIGHGGKSNIIRRNARPVLSTEELHHADLLRIGETTLRFVALCGSDFQWNAPEDSHALGL